MILVIRTKLLSAIVFEFMRQFINIFTQNFLDWMELKSPQFNSTLVGASLWEVSKLGDHGSLAHLTLDVKGQGQDEMQFRHNICVDMMYNFVSLGK